MQIYQQVIFTISSSSNTLLLWYDKPSSEIPLIGIDNSRFYFDRTHDNLIWQQNTLPIGNGYFGANIYGEIKTERITFNEKTLWNGGPSKKRSNYNGGNSENSGQNGKLFREIQELFKEGKDEEAAEKCQTLLGDDDREGLGSYQEFGELQFDFLNTQPKKVFDYIRSLDLDTATAKVNYKYKRKNGEAVTVNREYFASYPDKIICIKMNFQISSSIECRFISQHNQTRTTVDSNQITIEGELADNNMKYNGKIYVVPKDGKVKKKSNSLLIEDITEVVFYVTAATDYNNSFPVYRTGETNGELDTRVQRVIDAAVAKGYEKIRKNHLIDYKTIFERVHLDIGQKSSPIPTNELLTQYKEYISQSMNYNKLTPQFRYLEVLLFQYGRYLDISSSRKGSLPPNLQGVWNDQTINVPWGSDYHTNVNLQMNYWPTFSTNMAELGLPLLEFIESVREPGRVTAKIYTGIESNDTEKNGFMVHHRLNPFGFTAPGWKFVFGWSPTSLLWILHNVFEIFLYTNDIELLRNRIYPLLREEAFYFEKLLVHDVKNNRTITSPASSPEQGPPTNGNTYEQTNLWQHFSNTLMSAKLLKVDQKYYEHWESLINSFKPIEIGESGQIKEWYCEKKLGSLGEKNHRHLSHLLGLFPYNLINRKTPDWISAAIISLNDRGDETTGWAMAQRINAWARIGDGNRAFKLIQSLLKNGIYSNLWDTHPPFQIDGNFGATSGITEMLMQSTFNRIVMLPALPDVWMKSGSFKGLVAKGNIVVSCKWKNGNAYKITVEPRFDAEINIKCNGINKATVYDDDKGQEIKFKSVDENEIIINALANCLYFIKF